MQTNISQVPTSQTEIEALPIPDVVQTAEMSSYPDDFPDMTRTPPDSMKLTIRICGPQPTAVRTIPGAITSGMQRELASDIAVKLNRQSLAQPELKTWHVVAATVSSGYVVVRMVLQETGWKPTSEYDTPPSAESGLMNGCCRMTINAFNRMQLRSGGPVQFWQLHVKPLEYPKFSSRDDLTADESEAIQQVSEALAAELDVRRLRNRNLQIQFSEEFSKLCWESEFGDRSGLAKQLRNLADRLNRAANSVQRQPAAQPNRVSLHAIQPRERSIRIDGCDDVELLVKNVQTDDEAFTIAREALASLGR